MEQKLERRVTMDETASDEDSMEILKWILIREGFLSRLHSALLEMKENGTKVDASAGTSLYIYRSRFAHLCLDTYISIYISIYLYTDRSIYIHIYQDRKVHLYIYLYRICRSNDTQPGRHIDR